MTPQQLNTMRLALEALDIAQGMLAVLRSHHQPKMLSAYTAIKEALAEHAMSEVQRLGQEIEPKIGCVNHDCDQCKAQPEQEPVAWAMDYDIESVLSGFSTSLMGTAMRIESAFPKHRVKLLYTTPPQRTWVGLTDEDMYVVSEEESCSFIAGAKWSEEILKEKNT